MTPSPDLPIGDLFGARLVHAWEPPEDVVITAGVAFTKSLQPEDYGVLIRLLLRDPRLPSTMGVMAKEMRESGWKMGDDRFRVIFNRLKKAGHVEQVSEYNVETGRPGWVIRVYRNPANNQQYVALGIEASSQVNSGSREIPDPGAKQSSESGKTRVSRGQIRNPENPGSGFAPPHPPVGEEVNTSSPTPLTRNRGEEPRLRTGPADLARPDVDQKAVLTASEFLQGLQGQWQCGPKTANRLAKLLARTAADQGWVLDDSLASQLTGGNQVFTSLLGTLRSRIEDLPRSRPVFPGQARGEVVPATPVDVCDMCRGSDPRPGWVYDAHPVTGADITVRCTHGAATAVG